MINVLDLVSFANVEHILDLNTFLLHPFYNAFHLYDFFFDIRCLDKAALIPEPTNKTFNMIQSPWTHSSITKIEEVKMFLRLLPILASTTMFWTTYAQIYNSFI